MLNCSDFFLICMLWYYLFTFVNKLPEHRTQQHSESPIFHFKTVMAACFFVSTISCFECIISRGLLVQHDFASDPFISVFLTDKSKKHRIWNRTTKMQEKNVFFLKLIDPVWSRGVYNDSGQYCKGKHSEQSLNPSGHLKLVCSPTVWRENKEKLPTLWTFGEIHPSRGMKQYSGGEI